MFKYALIIIKKFAEIKHNENELFNIFDKERFIIE